MKHIYYTLGIACLVFLCQSSLMAQDVGDADTVQIASVSVDLSGEYANPYPVSVSVFNDNELTTLVIPLVVDGYSGWVRFDSVSFADGRLLDPAVLADREAFSFNTDSLTVDSLVLKLEVGAGNPLPAGDGKICDLWFRSLYGGEVAIDSSVASPYGRLRLTTTSEEEFTPQFASGLIDIDCDYMIGDVRVSGIVNVEDVLGMHKGYLGCFDYDYTDPWRADVNCDRLTDLRDVVSHFDYVWKDSTEIFCDCGSYSPAYYNDPGNPDTVWIETETLYVGVETTIDIGIVNDEPLRGFALALEWDGSAILGYYSYEPSDRLQNLDVMVGHYECQGSDQVNPDTLFSATWNSFTSIPPGSDAVLHVTFTPLTAGTVSFRLVSYYPDGQWVTTIGGQSMLVTEDKAAILPVMVGGQLTVLPYRCGDANGDNAINIGDAVYLINYVFRSGAAPDPLCIGDANNDAAVNIGDATYLLGYIFKGGAAPHDNCCSPPNQ